MAAAASRHYAIYQGKHRERIKGRALRRTKTGHCVGRRRGFGLLFVLRFLVRLRFFSGNRIYFWVARGIYMWRAAGSGPTPKRTIYMKVNVKYSHQDI